MNCVAVIVVDSVSSHICRVAWSMQRCALFVLIVAHCADFTVQSARARASDGALALTLLQALARPGSAHLRGQAPRTCAVKLRAPAQGSRWTTACTIARSPGMLVFSRSNRFDLLMSVLR